MFSIIDGDIRVKGKSGNFIDVDVNGALLTRAAQAEAPAGQTPIVLTYYSSLGTTYTDYYVIPTNKFLVIQSIEAMAAVSAQGTGIEIFFQPNGNTTGESMICLPVAVNGTNFTKWIYWTTPQAGNGTRRLSIIRRRYDSTARYVGVEIRGYLEDVT